MARTLENPMSSRENILAKAKANNLDVANQGIVFLLIVAFPFDNALFHFSTFLLMFSVSLLFNQIGLAQLLSILKDAKHVHLAFAAIVALMVLSNLINGQNGEAWRATFVFVFRYWLLLTVLLCLFYYQLLSIRILMLATACALLMQFLPFFPEIYNGSIFSSRFRGFSSNPNVIGLYAATGVLLGAFFLRYRGKYLPAVLLFGTCLIGLSAIILLATGNRGSWVSLLGALVVFGVFEMRQKPMAVAAVFALLAIFCVIIFSNFALPMDRLALLMDGDPSLRYEVWQNTLAHFLQKPLFGHGLDTSAVLTQSHFIRSEHNIFLSVLLAMGVVGLAAYIYLLFNICFPALKNKDSVGLSFMTLLMGTGMFSFDFYRDQNFLISFVIVSAVCLYARPTPPQAS